MNRQDKHRTEHQERREHEKAEQKQFQIAQAKKPRTIHPAWFLMLGVVLIITVVLIWTTI